MAGERAPLRLDGEPRLLQRCLGRTRAALLGMGATLSAQVGLGVSTLLLYVIRVGTSLSLGTLEKARAPPTAARRRRSFEAMGSTVPGREGWR